MKYRDVLRKLAGEDAEDKYHDLRRRYYADEYTDTDEKSLPDDLEERDIAWYRDHPEYGEKARLQNLSYRLKERQRILDMMENLIGWNSDNEPQEFGAFLRKIKDMRNNALFAKYLPAKGYLDINKVKDRKHAGALLEALTDEQLNNVTLPTNDYNGQPWKAPSTPFNGPDGSDRKQLYYSYDDVLGGRYGEDIKSRVLNKEIRTFGDWNRVLAAEYKKLPREARNMVKEDLDYIRSRR